MLIYVTPKSGFRQLTTFNVLVAPHPVEVCVNVRVTVPAATPDTKPALVIVAIAVLLLAQVPPVFGVTLAVLPTHTDVAPPNVGEPGTVLMTTLVLGAEVQVFVLVTVKV
jgi:hypothetical protein